MKNILTSARSFIRRFRYGTPDPARDWLAMITLAAIVLVGIFVWNIWVFGTAASGGVIGSSATSIPTIFDQADLNTIHTIFANRAAERTKYETGTYNFADPSQ